MWGRSIREALGMLAPHIMAREELLAAQREEQQARLERALADARITYNQALAANMRKFLEDIGEVV
jgi:hypothetical protein